MDGERVSSRPSAGKHKVKSAQRRARGEELHQEGWESDERGAVEPTLLTLQRENQTQFAPSLIPVCLVYIQHRAPLRDGNTFSATQQHFIFELFIILLHLELCEQRATGNPTWEK